MSSTLARIDKELYNQLQEFSLQKHRNARSTKTELEEAVKQYLKKKNRKRELTK